jgi:hypothetical protein
MLISKRTAAAAICVALVFGVSTAALAVEMSLAGIKLSRPAVDVLKKYGNPTRVTVGTLSIPSAGSESAPGGMPVPGATSYPVPTGTSYPGFGIEPGAAPVLPGLPGMPMPGMTIPGMPGQGMPGTQTVQPAITEQQVTWTYDLPNGITVEFIISETGSVVQITVGGDQPFASSRTSKGTKLGSNYKEVIFKYGYPEGQSYAGRFLRVSYADRHRVVFTLLGKKVVGITIALKPD